MKIADVIGRFIIKPYGMVHTDNKKFSGNKPDPDLKADEVYPLKINTQNFTEFRQNFLEIYQNF